MKNRLELFREQIAAFDGAADPMRAIDKGYVIEEPHQSSINALFKRISLKPQSKILLIGGIGSGKTTQLLRLHQNFQQAHDIGIYPHYIDITKHTNSNDIQIGTLNAIIGLELITLLEGKGFQVDEGRRKFIQEFAYGSAAIQLIPNLSSMLKVPGVLSPSSRSSNSSIQLVRILSSLIEDFQTQFKQIPYLFLDGLDRVEEAEKFTRMALSDLRASKIGLLIVGSANLLYSSFIDSIDSVFDHIEYRSAFDVEKDKKAITFFEQVLLVRSSKNFFHKSALQELIRLSGGVLRDLINLTQESIQEAYLADAEMVNQEHVEKAARSMGRAKLLGLSSEQYDTLEILPKSILVAPTSPEEIYLLSSGRILEYRFPERRFALHPVLKQLLV